MNKWSFIYIKYALVFRTWNQQGLQPMTLPGQVLEMNPYTESVYLQGIASAGSQVHIPNI